MTQDRATEDRTADERPDSVDGTEVVRLDLPAASSRLRLVRLSVVGLATDYGADVDDLEDVRIATGEICTHLVSAAPAGARLRVEVRAHHDPEQQPDRVTIEVSATVDGVTDPGPLDELSDMILATAASEHGVEAGPAGARAHFRRTLHTVVTDDVQRGNA